MDTTTHLHFAHYEVRRRDDGTAWELGRGAMGVTYKAYDPRLRVEVALKVINPSQVGNARAQALFLREARAAARVHQSNVANVVYLNEEPSNPFYAMEFIKGESLHDWLPAHRPLSALLVIRLAEQLALGLEAIHAEQIVHRDLKPTNIMIVRTSRGREMGASDANPDTWQAKIIDFGLARAFAGDSLGTESGALTTGFRGTAIYASPEQCQEHTEIDGRSDLYSLGCILWEMLVGSPPFQGKSLHELLLKHVSQPPPVEKLADVPSCLQAIVAQLLMKEPDSRFASAAALVKALERSQDRIMGGLEGTGASSDPSELLTVTSDGFGSDGVGKIQSTTATRLLRRRFLVAGGIAAAVLALGVATDWGQRLRGSRESPRQDSGTSALTAKVATTKALSSDYVANELYERAVQLLRVAGSTIDASRMKSDLDQAIKWLSEAVARDANFAAAWRLLATRHHYAYMISLDHTPARLELSQAAAQTAVRLAPDAGETHLMLGQINVFKGDAEGAEKELALARQSLPNDPEMYYLAQQVDDIRGRSEESIRNMERASELDPLNEKYLYILSLRYFGRYEDQVRTLKRLAALRPGALEPQMMLCDVEEDRSGNLEPYLKLFESLRDRPAGTIPGNVLDNMLQVAFYRRDADLAERALALLGDATKPVYLSGVPYPRGFIVGRIAKMRGNEVAARTALESARTEAAAKVAQQPEALWPLMILAQIDSELGQKEAALRTAERARELAHIEKNTPVELVFTKLLAEIESQNGEIDRALAHLKEVVDAGPISYGDLVLPTIWEPLRKDPRFQALLAKRAPKEQLK